MSLLSRCSAIFVFVYLLLVKLINLLTAFSAAAVAATFDSLCTKPNRDTFPHTNSKNQTQPRVGDLILSDSEEKYKHSAIVSDKRRKKITETALFFPFFLSLLLPLSRFSYAVAHLSLTPAKGDHLIDHSFLSSAIFSSFFALSVIVMRSLVTTHTHTHKTRRAASMRVGLPLTPTPSHLPTRSQSLSIGPTNFLNVDEAVRARRLVKNTTQTHCQWVGVAQKLCPLIWGRKSKYFRLLWTFSSVVQCFPTARYTRLWLTTLENATLAGQVKLTETSNLHRFLTELTHTGDRRTKIWAKRTRDAN